MQLPKKYYAKDAESVILPAGYYAVQIIGEKQLPMNSKGNQSLMFILEVTEGAFKGAITNDYIAQQSSQQWMLEQADRKLSSYVNSVGLLEISNTEQLFNKKFVCQLSLVVDPNGEKKDTNRVESIFKYDPSILQIAVKQQTKQAQTQIQTQNKQVAPQQAQNTGFRPSAPIAQPMQTNSNVYANSSLSSAFNNQQNAQAQYMNYTPQQAQPMQQQAQAQQFQTNDENLPF